MRVCVVSTRPVSTQYVSHESWCSCWGASTVVLGAAKLAEMKIANQTDGAKEISCFIICCLVLVLLAGKTSYFLERKARTKSVERTKAIVSYKW